MQQLIVMENMVSEIKIMTKMVEQDIKNMKSDINYLKVENKDLQLELKVVKNTNKSSNEKAEKALEKITLRNSSEFGEDWLVQKDIGLLFEPCFTSHQIGKLLRVCGLAMKRRSKTTPTQKSIKTGYVRRSLKDNYLGYHWYAPSVKNTIIKMLKNKNVYNDVLLSNTQEELNEILCSIY